GQAITLAHSSRGAGPGLLSESRAPRTAAVGLALGRRRGEMSQTRRLAAILAADVAGYSRLIGVDEGGTLQIFKTIREEVFDPKITAHQAGWSRRRVTASSPSSAVSSTLYAVRPYPGFCREPDTARTSVAGEPRRWTSSMRSALLSRFRVSWSVFWSD